jgi:hypothetical protein
MDAPKTPQHLLQTLRPLSLAKHMTLGGGVGLFLITVFLATAEGTDPAWGRYWWIRPLVVVPMAGAAAGAIYYLMDLLALKWGWNRIIIGMAGFVLLFISLWLGSVLGLDGTYWD